MLYNLLLEVDESFKLAEEDQDGNVIYFVDSDIVATLADLHTLYYSGTVPGTVPVANRKLAHAVIETDAQDVYTLVGSLIIAYSLNWEVRALQPYYDSFDAPVDPDDPNDFGQLIINYPVDAQALVYLQDKHTYDEDGNITSTLTKDKSWIHQWQGQSEWH